MKNTGITYTSAERSPVILPEMAELLPPLSAEQLDALEADLIKNGCYSPIIVNEDMVIIDGHNRQALCEKHGLPYTMAVFSFEDMLEAKQWALDTQKGRRNLEKWELGKIALKLKPEIEAKAKANMAAGGQNFRPSEAEEGSATLPNLPSVEKAVDIDALQDAYRKRLGQRLMSTIRDETGKREVLAASGGEYVIVDCCNDPQKLKAIRHRIQAQMNGLDVSAGKVRKRVRFLERFASWVRKETSDGAA